MRTASCLWGLVPLVLGAACVGLFACKEGEDVATGTPALTSSVADAGTDATAPSALDFTAFEKAVFDGTSKTEGVVVQHDGRVVYEKYAAGFDATKRHITYSVSKSIGSALIGIAVADGLLELEDSICQHVPAPEGADPAYCDTTLDHLLHMSSGLNWTESYADPATSNVLAMLYGGEEDMGLYVALRPRAAKAGELWSYSSGDANLLARALRSALGSKDMRAWAKEKLFDPAGMSSVIFETDRSGTLVFSSSAFMTPRDMARFGQLYLDDGMNGATRVLPSAWVTYTQKPAPAASIPRPEGGSYGASFWLNAATPAAPGYLREFPKAPVDLFSAEGHWGQFISIVPSRRLVVVRVGNDRDPVFDAGPMLEQAVLAVDRTSVGAQ